VVFDVWFVRFYVVEFEVSVIFEVMLEVLLFESEMFEVKLSVALSKKKVELSVALSKADVELSVKLSK
jgi:hypothetical protein